MEVSFNKELWYDQKCLNCGDTSPENSYSLALAPREKVQGACGEAKDKRLYIFIKSLNMGSKSVLTNYKLKNIQVKQP